jgi:DNA-binding MarR family transcriptional regulator
MRSKTVSAIEVAVVALRRSARRQALAGLSRRRGERAGPAGSLPDAVFELLDAVAEHQPLTPTQAAALLGVDQPRASRLAAQALQAGLVRREADQADGRRSPLSLTSDGQRVIDHIRAFRQRVIENATAGWSEQDLATLAELLTRFIADMGAETS